jgi:DNA-binding transcriptional MerR regulator/class 3 adenylate cyclase
MSTRLKIGELASKSGLSRDTIRFYEREALLPQPERTPAGYRLYSPDVVERLLFIKQAQALGFSLTEIREVLDGYHDASECRHVASLLSQKIAELDQRLHAIQALRALLSRYLSVCKQALANGHAHEGCPVLCDLGHQTADAFQSHPLEEQPPIVEDIEAYAQKFVPSGVFRHLKRSPHLIQGGKRVAEVAVMFVDVQGCSILCEELPPGQMHHLLEVAFSDFFTCVEGAGGDVNEIMGDGFMALFEGESLRESAHAAAQAALAIRAHAAACARVAGLPEVPLVVNMGLHAGNAFVGMTRFTGRFGERWTYTASGPVTNLAARLCALAYDGAVFLSQETAVLLANTCIVEPAGVYDLKNIGPAMRVSRLLGMRTPATTPHTQP